MAKIRFPYQYMNSKTKHWWIKEEYDHKPEHHINKALLFLKENRDMFIEFLIMDNYAIIVEKLKPYSLGNDETGLYITVGVTPSEIDKKTIALGEMLSWAILDDDMKIFTLIIEKGIMDLWPVFSTNVHLKEITLYMLSLILEQPNINEKIIEKFFRIYRDDITIMFLDKGWKPIDSVIKYGLTNGKVSFIKILLLYNYDIQSFCEIYKNIIFDKFNPLGLQMVKFLHENINLSPHANDILMSNVLGDIKIMEFIMDNYQDLDLEKAYGEACLNNKIDKMKLILDRGVNLNATKISWNFEFNTFKFLIDHGYIFDDGIMWIYFLKFFTCDSKLEHALYLLEHGCKMSMFSIQNETLPLSEYILLSSQYYYLLPCPLEHIVANGKMEHVKFLIENYYSVISPEFNRLWIIACANGQLEMAKLLFSHDPNLDIKALVSACFFGHGNTVEWLYELGLDHMQVDENLFEVVEDGENIKFESFSRIKPAIVKSKTYVNLTNDDVFRNDIFHYGEHTEVNHILMKHDIPIPIRNTISRIHKNKFDPILFKYYIDHGMNINSKCQDRTLLEDTIMCNQYDLTKLLLDYGESAIIVNPVALDIVRKDENLRMILENYGFIMEKIDIKSS